MTNSRSFGRRAAAPPAASVRQAQPSAGTTPFVPPTPSEDEELEKWRRSRKFQFPWRQLSLMASLCFGVAALALPDSVNEAAQWLLYLLAAASLVSGFIRRSGT
jgi:hypothetical protein